MINFVPYNVEGSQKRGLGAATDANFLNQLLKAIVSAETIIKRNKFWEKLSSYDVV